MPKESRKESYQRGLQLTQAYGPYTLQRRDADSGEWKSIQGILEGRVEAFAELARVKKLEPTLEWRVLPTNEAEKYREGLKQGIEIGKSLGPEEDEDKIPRGMALPEHM